MSAKRWTILIDKDDIKQTKVQPLKETVPKLENGTIEVTVRSFALTANNITYATLGKSFGSWTDMPGYWAFFPFSDDAYGQLPIWGFADVTKSAHPDISVGEELYGYFPMASHLIIRPGHVSKSSIIDNMPHREKLAPVYNQYNRVSAMTELKAEEKDLWPVFRPLLVTGYMICDQYEENNYYGADALILTSASSKTALMTAKCFQGFEGVPKLVGLTSSGNKEFVEKSGLYDTVLTYDEIESIPSTTKTALIDLAGNGDVIGRIHNHFGDALKFSLLVGLSHWDSSRPTRGLPGPKPIPFFAPGRIKQRSGEWGGNGLRDRLAVAWDSFASLAPTLTTLDIQTGSDAAKDAYDKLIEGKINPEISTLISLS
ncbi:MAG: DUF2855 family protein [Sneathiella sp.]